MSQSSNFAFQGLFTYPSDISAVPPGSLAIARNLNLSRTNIAEPRRGFDILANLPLTTDRADKLFFYNNSTLVHYGSLLALYETGTFTSKGAISVPTFATSIRSVSLSQNLFLTSSEGIKKMDSTTGNLYAAGIPNALHSTLNLVSGINLAVPTDSSVAYRWVLARKDANNNVITGGVSSKALITNAAGGTRDVTLRCYLPGGVDNSYYASIYRTVSVPSTVTPGEEMQQVLQHNITSIEAAQGWFDETDITPDALLGAALYTNPTQEGIIKNNAQPPLARDIAEYKSIAFYADVEGYHRYTFTLLACGTTGAQLRVDDTITINNGVTTEIYQAKATENIGAKQFLVDVASASPSTRIANTVNSLINVINRGSVLVYATIQTVDASSLPGIIVLQGRTLGAAAFTTVSSRDTAFDPTLKTPAGLNQTSTNSSFKNGLMYSKKDQPEAVPLVNIFFIGDADDRIKRIVALKDSLLIFKEKGGVYRLSGENETSFSRTLLDSTAKIVAPDSLQVLNGSVFGLFQSGICQVTDSDVSIISQPVKDKLQTLFGSALEATRTYTFSIGYETDGKYILCLPSTSIDTYSTYQLIYDVFGGSFVEWDLNMRAAGVNPVDGLIYYAEATSSRVRTERKLYDYTDFADFEQQATLTATLGTVLTISGIDTMEVGDLLNQADLLPAYIVAVDTGAGTVIVDLDQTWNLLLPVSHFKGIHVEIEWNRETSGNPAGLKHYQEISLPFKRNFIGAASIKFSSDTNPGVNGFTIAGPTAQGAWGYNAWDEGVWGGESTPIPKRVGVSRSNARCNSLTVNFSQKVAFSDFQLEGISLIFNATSTRVAR